MTVYKKPVCSGVGGGDVPDLSLWAVRAHAQLSRVSPGPWLLCCRWGRRRRGIPRAVDCVESAPKRRSEGLERTLLCLGSSH